MSSNSLFFLVSWRYKCGPLPLSNNNENNVTRGYGWTWMAVDKSLQFSKKNKELEDMVRTFAEILQAEQARASSAAAATGSVEVIVGEKLSELGKRKRAETCSKARETASQALSAKLERKQIRLG